MDEIATFNIIVEHIDIPGADQVQHRVVLTITGLSSASVANDAVRWLQEAISRHIVALGQADSVVPPPRREGGH
jgi:hypothetical protein